MFKAILKKDNPSAKYSAKDKFTMSNVTVDSNQCNKCAHFQPEQEGLICKAFPKGIPMDIFMGKVDHTKPVNGDNGITFKSK